MRWLLLLSSAKECAEPADDRLLPLRVGFVSSSCTMRFTRTRLSVHPVSSLQLTKPHDQCPVVRDCNNLVKSRDSTLAFVMSSPRSLANVAGRADRRRRGGRPAPRRVTVLAHRLRGARTLTPGDMHIMLVGLKQPLREGQTFPLTLEFRKAGKGDTRKPNQNEPASPQSPRQARAACPSL